MRKATEKRLACPNKQVKLDAENYESKIGVNYSDENESRVGYLANVKPTTHVDENGNDLAAVLLYFIEETGGWFKALRVYEPYFYVQCDDLHIGDVVFVLNKTYEERVKAIERVEKEDLALVNHLSGKRGQFVKLVFKNVQDLMDVKKELQRTVEKNKAEREKLEAYDTGERQDSMAQILAIREYDVAYHIRTMIDLEIRCSFWYEVTLAGPMLGSIKHLPEKLDKPDLRVCAFDIETTKEELRFPDSSTDQVMMISYIIDGAGFLITNRFVVGDDVVDFEYAPKDEYDVGTFTVFNEPDERALLVKFFSHMRETKPFIYVTYNGDFFDWPFIQDRAEHYQMKIEEEIGIYCGSMGEMMGRWAPHLDCLYWVKRDAYLPQGSHGLKAVTKAKLGYDPVELDHELMLPYARDKPQQLAEYSVSDAVATYFLYKKMIHDFIFALCTIIPTYPDEVLRRGSGTLCENLLMAQAYRGEIIFPNKQVGQFERYHDGKLIDSDTYTGGTVECLQQGVFRSDIPVNFKLNAEGYDRLLRETDDIMRFAIEIEGGASVDDVTNYDEVRNEVVQALTDLKARCPHIESEPLIYHVDVAAMYPNIILSNRLQPVAIVNEEICAGCLFNQDKNRCKRHLDWQWKGEMFPLSRMEFQRIKLQLEDEEQAQKARQSSNARDSGFGRGSSDQKGGNNKDSSTFEERLRARIKAYCQRSYKQVHSRKQELRTDTVCMRENPFYVDTVRDFRDRRYEFKRLTKSWNGKMKEALKSGDSEAAEVAKNRATLYDSLQLAHKIILNSFYGYVMKKGARWYSMEMAAMVTHTGGCIITESRQLFDLIGMPLELDTDGIWTLLPKGFPEAYSFELKNGKKLNFEFPCTMCNNLIYEKYGNDQYQTKRSGSLQYDIRNEMSVFFEIDGPYRCMLIPAAKEEGKMLKKRYAVFNHAGKMTEVKGFELKRRGELKIVKIFQEEVFGRFLEGANLQECYDACGEVGKRWYEILEQQGGGLEDEELIEYIGEERVISKKLSAYGSSKSTSITCAYRLGELLGPAMLRDDAGGLNVKFIISKKPIDAKVAARAIPTIIFQEKQQIKEKYLRKWTKDTNLKDYDLASILDWDYYKERLGGSIQKIITIPAFLQKCMNPIPQIAYPTWLYKMKMAQDDKFKQKGISQFYKTIRIPKPGPKDIEDLAKKAIAPVKPKIEKPEKVDPYADMAKCPKPQEDFSEWIKYQKTNWRAIRRKFKTKKQVVDHAMQSVSLGPRAQLSNFLTSKDNVIYGSLWNVVSVEEGHAPGQLRLWVFVKVDGQGHMFNVALKVPRTIYINSRVVSNDPKFRRVANKHLPRERPLHNLYEWQVSEEEFRRKFSAIESKYLVNSAIEGVYETKTPLRFRAISEISCMLRPKRNQINLAQMALSRDYSLNELEALPSTEEDCYLASDSYQLIQILHCQSQERTGARHVFGVLFEATRELYFFCVDPTVKKTGQIDGEMQTIKAEYHKKAAELSDKWEIDLIAIQLVQEFSYPDLKAAVRAMDKFIKEKNGFRGSDFNPATLCVLNSQELTASKLARLGASSLCSEFPVIRGHFVYDEPIVGIQWLKSCVRNITVQIIYARFWIKERVDASRYGLVPLGNLDNGSSPGPTPAAMIDTMFARALKRDRHVLWYSDERGMPDLGGHESEDFRAYFQEAIQNPEKTEKGLYRGGYTIEVNVHDLVVNTVLQSENLQEFEETIRAASNPNNSKSKAPTTIDTDLDEVITCAPTFKVLRGLLRTWDLDRSQNKPADQLCMSFTRWLQSPSTAPSRLHDPLLQRLVHRLSCQVFNLLMKRLKMLDCRVIYASFHKLLIYTGKTTDEDAQGHVNFAIRTVMKDPLFAKLRLEIGESYSILLFKDIANMAGVREAEPTRTFLSMDLVTHLPEAIRVHFGELVQLFIAQIAAHNRKLIKERDNYDDADGIRQNANGEFTTRAPDHDFIADLVGKKFAYKLFTLVGDFLSRKADEVVAAEGTDEEVEDPDEERIEEDLREQYWEEDPLGEFANPIGKINRDTNALVEARKRRERERLLRERRRWEFPDRIGSHCEYVSPALEFSKLMCAHILSCDEAFQYEASQVKASLLRMIHCKEFSPEATQGLEPSLVLVIPDVVCENCLHVADLDICRDPALTGNQAPSSRPYDVAANSSAWLCPQCDGELSKLEIEQRLMDLVNKRLVSYQMQDLACVKCKMVKNNLSSQYCDCTGEFEQTLGMINPAKLQTPNLVNEMSDIQLFMRLMRNFAQAHGFVVLRDMTSQIMEVCE